MSYECAMSETFTRVMQELSKAFNDHPKKGNLTLSNIYIIRDEATMTVSQVSSRDTKRAAIKYEPGISRVRFVLYGEPANNFPGNRSELIFQQLVDAHVTAVVEALLTYASWSI